MGILYSDEWIEDCDCLREENAVSCDLPLIQEAPIFVLRPIRRSRRRTTRRFRPFYPLLSDLSDDTDIAHLISSIPCITPTIQHRNHISSTSASIIDIDIPQSLPLNTAALSSNQSTGSGILLAGINNPTFLSSEEDWTFVTHKHTRHDSTPLSEPETWILCDDLQQISPH